MVSHGKTSPATAKAKAHRNAKKPAAAASQPEKHRTAHVAPVEPASVDPVVVKAGSRSKSSLRHLEQGTGPLVHEISQIVHAIQATVPGPVPIVIVYREKRSSGSRSVSPFEFLPL